MRSTCLVFEMSETDGKKKTKQKRESTSEHPWHLTGKGYVYNANLLSLTGPHISAKYNTSITTDSFKKKRKV